MAGTGDTSWRWSSSDNSLSMSPCSNPLLRKNSAFLSGDDLRTSSSSRNFRACSKVFCSGASRPDAVAGSSFSGVGGACCHVGIAGFRVWSSSLSPMTALFC